MAGSVEPTPPNRRSPFPWQEVLVANGFVSLFLGLAALLFASLYSADAYNWLQRSTAEDFSRIVRLAVLCYLLYGLILLGVGLSWLAVSGYRNRRKNQLAVSERNEAR